MAKTRVAIVGAGGIGSTHLRAYADWPELCEMVGIADINVAAAEEKANQFGGMAYANFEQMLDEARPDVISVCTPPNMHLPVARAAAKRNLSVLCEKPPARTVAETQAIIEAMKGSKGILQFAFCHRFHRSVVQARELIASGKLGRVVQVNNRFGFRFDRAGKSWFTDKETAGGGVLIDTLVHSIDVFRVLLGEEIANVSASISTVLPIQVEDSASILVTSTGGTAGSLNCSWVTPVSEAEFHIYATEGEAIIDYRQSEGLRYQLADQSEWTQLPFDTPDRFTLQAESFLKTASSGGKPAAGGADAIAAMKVIEAAYQAAKGRTQVAI